MARRILAFCILALLGGSTIGIQEDSPSAHGRHVNSLLGGSSSSVFDEPAEKRAYTYVSEYKRLPLYNFGIGKRWIDSDDKKARRYMLGIGKRTRLYEFGLGKRNQEKQDYYPSRFLDWDDLARDSGGFQEIYQDKRANGYNFGLGKRGVAWSRLPSQSLNLEKRPKDDIEHMYRFGLGKRMTVQAMEDEQDQEQEQEDDTAAQ
ncbi:allatostatin A [Prorops nasuta]|uniref:allatostatin A n=1 Tax=Prorops nasuta TaxID=863751 RepID=UPI0034CFB793